MTRRRRTATELVRSEFPVVPMYIVSVLLLAFFVFTFRYGSREGYIEVEGPFDGKHLEFLRQQAIARGIPQPATFIVTANRGSGGSVGELTVQEQVDAPGRQIGVGIECYRAELQARKTAAGDRPSRLVLEIGNGILYGEFIRMLDVAIQFGFEEIEIGYDGPRVVTGARANR